MMVSSDDFYYIDKFAQRIDALQAADASTSRCILAQIQRVVDLHSNDVFASWYNEKAKAVDRMTFGELWEESGIIAHHLKANLGLEKGDLVVLCYNFGLHFIAAFLGCLRAGVVAVLVYPPYPPLAQTLPKMTKVVQDCQPKVILTDGLVDKLRQADQWNPLSKTRKEWPDSSIDFVVTDTLKAAPRITKEDDSLPFISDCGDELAFIQYTSGSTSDPKGVLVPHKVLAANIQAIHWRFRTFFDIQELDSVPMIGCSWLPQYHDLGLVWAILSPLCGGWEIHLMSPIDFIRKPLTWIRLLSNSKASFGAAPDFAYRLAARKFLQEKSKDAPPFDLSSMKVFLNGAEPVQLDTKSLFEASFGQFQLSDCWMAPCYGLAEHVVAVCGLNECRTSTLREEDTTPFMAVGSRHLTHPSIDIRIVDPTTKKELADETTGEIWVRGPGVASGYHGKPEISKECFDGWPETNGTTGGYLRTGDLGFYQNDYLFVCGRIKDTIVLNGVNYYPQDIEIAVQKAAPDAVRPGCVAAFSHSESGSMDEGRIIVVFEVRKEARDAVEPILPTIGSVVFEQTGIAISRVVAIEERSIPKTTSGKIKRSATRAALDEGRFKIVASSEPSIHLHLRERHCRASSSVITGASSNEGSPFDSDALVVGAGVVGLCFARDLASMGYKVTVVEKESCVGGVWATHSYPGLRLHTPGFSYRCLSLAPRWTREHSPTEMYRPTRDEVLEYCQQLADHPNISILFKTSCSTTPIRETESSVVVSVGWREHKTKYFFASIGVSRTHTGSPVIPDCLVAACVDGDYCVHSSQLSSSAIERCQGRGGRIFVVGGGKAAIDILQLFPAADESVVWAHRGHRMFVKRATVEDAFLDDGVDYCQKIATARNDAAKLPTEQSWCQLAHSTGTLVTCRGPLSSAKAIFGSGSCSIAELEHANTFLQFNLKSIDPIGKDHFALSPSDANDESFDVQANDLIILCTGQLNSSWKIPRYSPRTAYSVTFSAFGAASALVPLRLALAVLRKEQGFLHEAVNNINLVCADLKEKASADPSFLEILELGAPFFSCARRILCDAYGYQDISFFREWMDSWHGNDLVVEDVFDYLLNGRVPNCLPPSTGGGRCVTNIIEQLAALLRKAVAILDETPDAMVSLDSQPDFQVSSGEYKQYHSMMCSRPLAHRVLSTFSGVMLFLPYDYPRQVSALRAFDRSKHSVDDYFSLVQSTKTGLSTLLGATTCLCADEIDALSSGEENSTFDALLSVDQSILDYIKAKTGVQDLCLVRRFEFQFKGFANMSVIMLHYRSENGMLHLVEVYRPLSEGEITQSSRDLVDEALSRCRNAVKAPLPVSTNRGLKISATEVVGFISMICTYFDCAGIDVLLDKLLVPSLERRKENEAFLPIDIPSVQEPIAQKEATDQVVRQILAHSLRIEGSDLQGEISLVRLGMDSVTAYQILNEINEKCQVDIQANELFHCRTADEIGECVRMSRPRNAVSQSGGPQHVSASIQLEAKNHDSVADTDERRWFMPRAMPWKVQTEDSILLFCFHGMAGTASLSFGRFDQMLPGNVFPYLVCLPGNDGRTSESYPTDGDKLVRDVSKAIQSFVRGRRFALFGYCVGGQMATLIAHFLSHELKLTPVLTAVVCSSPHTDSPLERRRSARFYKNAFGPALEYYLSRSAALLYTLRQRCKRLWGEECPGVIGGSRLLVLGGHKDVFVPPSVLQSHWRPRRNEPPSRFSFQLIAGAGHYMTEDPNVGYGRRFTDESCFRKCWLAVGQALEEEIHSPNSEWVGFLPGTHAALSGAPLKTKRPVLGNDLMSVTSLDRRMYFLDVVMETEYEGHVSLGSFAQRLEATILAHPHKWIRFRSSFQSSISRWEPIADWSIERYGHVVVGPLVRAPSLQGSKLWFFEVIYEGNQFDGKTMLRCHMNHAIGDGYTLRSLCSDIVGHTETVWQLKHLRPLPGIEVYRRWNDHLIRKKVTRNVPPVLPLRSFKGTGKALVFPSLSIHQMKTAARRLAPGATVNDMLVFLVSHVKRQIGEEHEWLSCTFNQRGLEQMENMANVSAFMPVFVGKSGKMSAIQKYTQRLKHSNAVTFQGHLDMLENPEDKQYGIASKENDLIRGLSNVVGLTKEFDLLGHEHISSRCCVVVPGLFFFISSGDELTATFVADEGWPASRGEEIRNAFAHVAKKHCVLFEGSS